MFFFFFDDDEQNSFEDIKHLDADGAEYWLARELQEVLDYKRWDKFCDVISKAKEACANSGIPTSECFSHVGKTSPMPNGGYKEIDDIKLNRYACYLIAQNGDPRKEVIALAQTYFAVQTRKQELKETFDSLSEDQKRLAIRSDLKEHNKSLVEAARQAGVETQIDYATFQNKGYQGLYGGLGAQDIHKLKGLKKSEKILDHMGSEELAANLFRATQTDAKLRRDGVYGKDAANAVHFSVGEKVRQTIEELGGTMPEDLPVPKKSIKQLEKEEKKRLEACVQKLED